MTNDSHKVFLQAKDFKELIGIPHLREVIVLSYIINTMRSSQRFLLLTEERADGPTKSRDTTFGLITTLAFMYEAVRTAAGILKQLVAFLPSELHTDIAWIIDEERNGNSLWSTTLANIRNRIAFHFNLKVEDSILSDAVHAYPPVFEEGSSNRIIDSAYVLADEVITQMFSQCDPSSGTPQEKVIRLLQQLSQYNVRLCEVLDNVIAHLIANYAKRIEVGNRT